MAFGKTPFVSHIAGEGACSVTVGYHTELCVHMNAYRHGALMY